MAFIGQLSSILGAAGGLSSLLGGGGAAKKAQNLANKATGQEMELTQQQIDMIKNAMPFLSGIQTADQGLITPLAQNAEKGLQFAQSYDPSKQTSDLTRAYDESSAQSLGRDIGTPIAQQAMKGFTAGTGDSDTGGFLQGALAKRMVDRSNYVANLKAAEPGNLMNVVGQAGQNANNAFQALDPLSPLTGRYGGLAGSLNGAGQELGGISKTQQGIASGFDSTGAIGTINKALGGLFKNKSTNAWDNYSGNGWSLS